VALAQEVVDIVPGQARVYLQKRQVLRPVLNYAVGPLAPGNLAALAPSLDKDLLRIKSAAQVADKLGRHHSAAGGGRAGMNYAHSRAVKTQCRLPSPVNLRRTIIFF
jgi:hypothetical protein